MTRVLMMRAYAEDLLKWVAFSKREMYYSHNYEDHSKNLNLEGNVLAMFNPSRSTDIFAAGDGGIIKQL